MAVIRLDLTIEEIQYLLTTTKPDSVCGRAQIAYLQNMLEERQATELPVENITT